MTFVIRKRKGRKKRKTQTIKQNNNKPMRKVPLFRNSQGQVTETTDKLLA